MATKTHDLARLRALRLAVDAIRATPDSADAPLVEALRSYLTAAGYQDQALLESAREEIRVALGVSLAISIDQEVARCSIALGHFRQAIGLTGECVVVRLDEEDDDLGRAVSLAVSFVIRRLRSFRDGPIALAQDRGGVEIHNVAQLDEHIAHWNEVRANLVDCWPWSDAPLPPVDREMVARSRAAREAGEPGEDIDALIARLRSE